MNFPTSMQAELQCKADKPAPWVSPPTPGIPGAREAFLRLAIWDSEAQADDRLPRSSQSV